MADIWSLGCLAYAILTGHGPEPNPKEPIDYYADSIALGMVKYNVSEGARFFITKLIAIDPEKRLTANEARLEPWLKSS